MLKWLFGAKAEAIANKGGAEMSAMGRPRHWQPAGNQTFARCPGSGPPEPPLGVVSGAGRRRTRKGRRSIHNGELFVSKLGFFEVTKVPSSRLAP